MRGSVSFVVQVVLVLTLQATLKIYLEELWNNDDFTLLNKPLEPYNLS